MYAPEWKYRKLTAIWHFGERGLSDFQPRCCAHNARCSTWNATAKRHEQTFSSRRGVNGEIVSVPRELRYRIPPLLIKELLEEAAKEVVQYKDECSMLDT